jgi:hypothetical protein
MNDLGMPVIGLGEVGPQFAALPRRWMPHIQVADVGANAVVRDPVGACSALMQG